RELLKVRRDVRGAADLVDDVRREDAHPVQVLRAGAVVAGVLLEEKLAARLKPGGVDAQQGRAGGGADENVAAVHQRSDRLAGAVDEQPARIAWRPGRPLRPGRSLRSGGSLGSGRSGRSGKPLRSGRSWRSRGPREPGRVLMVLTCLVWADDANLVAVQVDAG